MIAYYNEFDPKAAAWLRELIRRGLLPAGEVDERSILDVSADDLVGFTQCHFFAGIGGWPYALRLAGWQDDWPVWTGSPPCQPFSAAGQQKGQADDRHLAPHFAALVAAGRPPILFGEQVASAAVFGKVAKKPRGGSGAEPEWAWIDDLQDRLEAAHYAVGASDIPAASVGAPHIRQRTFFGAVRLGNAANSGHIGRNVGNEVTPQRAALAREPVVLTNKRRGRDDATHDGSSGWLADASSQHIRRGSGKRNGSTGETESQARERERSRFDNSSCRSDVWADPSDGFWRDADWLFCRDGKWRPVEPGTFPLAHGIPARVGRLRGYGNAIVPQAASAFIKAFMQAHQEAAE
jgi:DNA (cytosine-5)-methyltransferase 1